MVLIFAEYHFRRLSGAVDAIVISNIEKIENEYKSKNEKARALARFPQLSPRIFSITYVNNYIIIYGGDTMPDSSNTKTILHNPARLILSFITLILLIVLILSAVPAADNIYPVFDPYSAFRLHIIANSDSPRDQAIKLVVRDALLDYERSLFKALPQEPGNAADTRSLLMDNGAGLLSTVKSALSDCGVDYPASLHVGEYSFPDRIYGDVFYPAGDYQALRVVLGNGDGRNWWCVMFPPLCIVEDIPGQSEDTTQIKDSSDAQNEDTNSSQVETLDEDTASNGDDANSAAPELKSLFAELFDWLRSLFS